MGKVTISELESYLRMKYIERNESASDYTIQSMSMSLFMKLVEEVGEVAEALNKIDGRKLDDGQSVLADELVDVIHYAVAIAAINKIDLEKSLLEKDTVASIKYNQNLNLSEYLEENKKK